MDYHILNCGAGVQSTTVALLVEDGEIVLPTETGKFDYAVFADTGDEPDDVYEHLEWLKGELSYPLEVLGGLSLGDDAIAGKNSTGQDYVTIPAFSSEGGMLRRQCTSEYKIKPIDRWVRRSLLGLKPRQHVPKDVHVHQYMCFSTDEPNRAARAKGRFNTTRWGSVHFPLFDDDVMMTRADCANYLRDRVPHRVPRSACVFCPYKSNAEWKHLRDNDPKGWQRAVEVDNALRGDHILHRKDDCGEMFIHRSMKPLEDVALDDSQKELFDMDCEGGCGL